MPKPGFMKDGPWTQTNSGRQVFYLQENQPGVNIWLPDIAHSLYNLQRFAGHLNSPGWTVGQHSMAMGLYCANTGCDHMTILDALLHDAHEAYMGDLPSPFKQAVPEVSRVQDKLQLDILKAFGIKDSKYAGEPWDRGGEQARLDLAMCRAEAEEFFDRIRDNWTQDFPTPDAEVLRAISQARDTNKTHFMAVVRQHARGAGINLANHRSFG